MMKRQLTKYEKEWKNLELGEMQEEDQIGLDDNEQDGGYDFSEN